VAARSPIVPELTGALRVGPQSAGAVPGPAAYGKGGSEPTVTDANVVLGYLPAQREARWRHGRSATAAPRRAVQKIADAMGSRLLEAAEGIVKIVNENMFGALRLVSVEKGYDPRDFALIGFGGAGPLHANALGILTGAWPVVIPPGPVCCAPMATRPRGCGRGLANVHCALTDVGSGGDRRGARELDRMRARRCSPKRRASRGVAAGR
jgi:N-methylhydantoinase A/oxoprolinase/acetone carboxylase beta subunit